MKTKSLFFILFVSFVSLSFVTYTWNFKTKEGNTKTVMQQDSVLRRIVLFKFKEGTSVENIKKVEEAFSELPSKIQQIASYEWGLNNSPEGLEKGFAHCFLLTFKSEEDRAAYLPHPDPKLLAMY